MGKVVIKQKSSKFIITNRLDGNESLNERITATISSGAYKQFIPISIRQKRKECILEAVVENYIPLRLYFSGVVSMRQFVNAVIGIIEAIKLCEINMMNVNNIYYDIDGIFVEPQTKNVHLLYWPIVNNTIEKTPADFFKKLPHGITFNTFEDNSYLQQYISFFNSIEPFSINNFERLINKIIGKKITKNNAPSGAMNGVEEENKLNVEKEDVIKIEYDPFDRFECKTTYDNQVHDQQSKENSVFCTECGAKNSLKSNFCVKCGTRLEKKQYEEPKIENDSLKRNGIANRNGTTVLGADYGGTTVLGFEELDGPVYPYLIREKNQEKILVNKPSFRLGKEKAFCDYFIFDNNYVSRSHADIITREGRYYIKDLNSTNKTYLDGRAIPIEKEIEIFSGTKIRLANEDFVFYIE